MAEPSLRDEHLAADVVDLVVRDDEGERGVPFDALFGHLGASLAARAGSSCSVPTSRRATGVSLLSWWDERSIAS